MAHFGLSHPREIYVHISKSLVPKALIFLPFSAAVDRGILAISVAKVPLQLEPQSLKPSKVQTDLPGYASPLADGDEVWGPHYIRA